MKQEIVDVIEKNLPSTVGTVLRARLEQADHYEKLVEKLEGELKDQREVSFNYSKQIEMLKAQLAQHDSLADREEKVHERERAIDLTVALTRAENAERSKADLFQLVGMVFKSPVVKESVMTNGKIPVPASSNGLYPVTMQQSSSTVTTKEVE